MNEIFKPEDFISDPGITDYISPEYSAYVANSKINKLIEDAPMVYCSSLDNFNGELWNEIDGKNRTHKARLLCIEKIVKGEQT